MNIPFNNLDRKGASRAVETQSSSVVSTIKGFFHDKLLKARTMALNTVAASVVTMQSAKAVFHDKFTKTAQVERVAAQETVEAEEYVEPMPDYIIDYSEEVAEGTAYMAEAEAPYVEEVPAYRVVDEEEAPTKASKKLFNIPFVQATSNEKAGAEVFALPEKEKNEELAVRLQKLEAAIKDPSTSVFDVPRLAAEFTGKSEEEMLTPDRGAPMTPRQFVYSLVFMHEAQQIKKQLLGENKSPSYTELLESKDVASSIVQFKKPTHQKNPSLFKENGKILQFARSEEASKAKEEAKHASIELQAREIYEENASQVKDNEKMKWAMLGWFTQDERRVYMDSREERDAVEALIAKQKGMPTAYEYDTSRIKVKE